MIQRSQTLSVAFVETLSRKGYFHPFWRRSPVLSFSYTLSTATTVPSTSSIVRRFNEGGEGRRARHRIYLQDGALPIPDIFSPRAPATGKLCSFAKGSPPPSPFARPSSPHQAAIDCSASERGNHQGIHPYTLRFTARFPSRPSTKRAALNESLSVLHPFPKRFQSSE